MTTDKTQKSEGLTTSEKHNELYTQLSEELGEFDLQYKPDQFNRDRWILETKEMVTKVTIRGFVITGVAHRIDRMRVFLRVENE